MREDCSRDYLCQDDLLNKLPSDQKGAKFAYSLFDLDGDGYVTEPEVQGRFHKIYRCAARAHIKPCQQQCWLAA